MANVIGWFLLFIMAAVALFTLGMMAMLVVSAGMDVRIKNDKLDQALEKARELEQMMGKDLKRHGIDRTV